MLLFAVLSLIGAFLSNVETDIWNTSERLLLPLLLVGSGLVVTNIVMRLLRPKLVVTLFEIDGEILKIRPVDNLQFSGWVARDPVAIEISSVTRARVFDFYNSANTAGMYWLCLELADGRIIEFNFVDPGLPAEIIEFVKNALPRVELELDPKLDT